MIEMIKVLIDKDFAYESCGNVMFRGTDIRLWVFPKNWEEIWQGQE